MSWSLTAEELHYLAAASELDFVPGLGPLPLAEDDPEALRLMLGTAERSLGARADLEALSALLVPLADPAWTASAELVADNVIGARGWWPVPGAVAELTQISPSDYWLEVIEDLRESVIAFLLLDGDDESVSAADELPESGVVVRATRLRRVGEGAEGVALEWIDAGEGPVWVLEPESVTRTGRAAVLRELLDGYLD